MKRRELSLGLAAATAVLAISALAASAQAPGAKGPAKVGVIEMQPQAVERSVTIPGRAVAYEQVAIRPRVTGLVTAVLYQPGKALRAGDPMFRLDAASYEASVAEAKAALAKAQAAVPVAEATLGRYQQLENVGSTRADVESARAALEQARADVQSAEAALQMAQTQLSWTEISSPIDGIADVAQVSVGDLVTSGQADGLATVTRIDPIYADMYETSARLAAIRQQIETGELKQTDRLVVRVTLENGESYSGTGELVAPGVTVSTTTGTRDFRFRLGNPEGRILPGMFLRGDVTLGTISAFLVPQMATDRARNGDLTAWVATPDDKARQVTLTEIGSRNSAWIVTGGLEAGDRLIVDGLAALSDGAALAPVAVTIDAEGVVHDQTPAAAPGAGAANPQAAPPAATAGKAP